MITVIVERDSICMADDAHFPNTITLEFADDATMQDVFDRLRTMRHESAVYRYDAIAVNRDSTFTDLRALGQKRLRALKQENRVHLYFRRN